MKTVAILGSTGTIGVNTLDVVARHPQRFRVAALTANTDDAALARQCAEWHPAYAVMADADGAERLRARLRDVDPDIRVLAGVEGLEQVARLPEVDAVMAGIVGGAGLRPSLAAARAGKRVLLANKEALVMSGALFMAAVQGSGAELLPIDSEHNAIFQCLPDRYVHGLDGVGVRRILLTASGGPFRNLPPAALERVTPAEAVAHPNWVMGRKISVDSATMMNKGLEVIEACWLFHTEPDRVRVVLHPQSIVHSMVEYVDGSVLAQLGNPDMRTPIAHALAWPERVGSGVAPLDLVGAPPLSFEEPDTAGFPCLGLGYDAARRGASAPAVLNAANEIAVAAFLEERLRFTDIPRVIEATLAGSTIRELDSLEDVLEVDARARGLAGEAVARMGGRPQ